MTKDILQSLIPLLNSTPDNPVLGVVWYGSKDPLGDFDYFIVQKNIMGVQHLSAGVLDISLLGKDFFESLLQKLDPIATEPILTGEFEFEDNNFLMRARDFVNNAKCDRSVVSYLITRSVEEYLSARSTTSRVINQQGSGTFAYSALVSLSFALTYLAFAKYYKTNPNSNVITLSNLLGQNAYPEVAKVLDIIKKTKRAQQLISRSDLESILVEYSMLLC